MKERKRKRLRENEVEFRDQAAKRLIAARGRRKQVFVAKTIGLKQSNLSKYESQKLSIPLPVLVDLARLYNVTTDWILTGEERIKQAGTEGIEIIEIPKSLGTSGDAPPPQDLGLRLRMIRSELGMAQPRFCASSGITVDDLDAWEAGRETPSDEALLLMETRMGIRAGFLRGDDGPPWVEEKVPAIAKVVNRTITIRQTDQGPLPSSDRHRLIPVVDSFTSTPWGWFPKVMPHAGYVCAHGSWLAPDGEYIAITATDERMAPRIRTGDTIIVNLNRRKPDDLIGSWVILKVRNRSPIAGTLQKDRNSHYLFPLSSDYQPMFLSIDEESSPVVGAIEWSIARHAPMPETVEEEETNIGNA